MIKLLGCLKVIHRDISSAYFFLIVDLRERGTLLQQTYVIKVLRFYPRASATAYGQRPKFVRAEHWATAGAENCAYGPTLRTTASGQ